jgi:hypothetical protein
MEVKGDSEVAQEAPKQQQQAGNKRQRGRLQLPASAKKGLEEATKTTAKVAADPEEEEKKRKRAERFGLDDAAKKQKTT